jgi:hypothetical protein
MTVTAESPDGERRAEDPGQLADRRDALCWRTEIWDTPQGPAEVKVAEVEWDLGNGPQRLQVIGGIPGCALGERGDRVGEVNPDEWTSLGVSYSYRLCQVDSGKVEIMVFGENDEDPDDERLYEKETVHLSAADARQFAQLLQDAASHIERMPGAEEPSTS